MPTVYPRLVLGAGPVGCAAALVLNAPAVGAVLGGHLDGPPAGPFHLWRTPHVATYLEALGLPRVPAEVRFGYLRADGFSSEASSEERARYYRRSRQLPADAPVPESAMSDGLPGALPVYAAAREDLRREMTRRIVFLRANITALLPGNDHVGPVWTVKTAEGELLARELISTLPAPVLYRLAGGAPADLRFEAREKVFLLPAAGAPGPAPLLPADVDYAYNLDEAREYDRVSAADGRECYEFNGKARFERFLASPAARGSWERLVNPFGQVISATGPLPPPVGWPSAPAVGEKAWAAVRPVGRLARWQHGERLHTALRALYALRDGS